MVSIEKGACLIEPKIMSQAPSLVDATPHSIKQMEMEEKPTLRLVDRPVSTQAAENNSGRIDGKDNGTMTAEKRSQFQPGQSEEAKTASEPRHEEHLLWSLPPELLDLTLNKIVDRPTIRALVLTCKAFYYMLTPRLHHRVSVSPGYHTEVLKLIRTLEPYMTTAQKKQLKREAKFIGQQDLFPTGHDEKLKPLCASWVKQLAVGILRSRRDLHYTIFRYLEEALFNMENLETVQFWLLTKPITQSLASLKNLQALDLILGRRASDEDLLALASIKGLKHLRLSDDAFDFVPERRKTMQTMIMNSASTLESLCVETGNLCPLQFDWAENDATLAAASSNKPILTALKSLSLKSNTMEHEGVDKIFRAVDFTQLVELGNCRLYKQDRYLYRKLADLAKTAESDGTGMKLRHLCVTMSRYGSDDDTMEDTAEKIEDISGLISLFNSLESLELDDYGEYPVAGATINPGLDNNMLQAILRNKNLKTLKLSYSGCSSNFRIPYLSPRDVGALIDGLPRLQKFEFAPDEAQITGIAQSLSRGAQLTSVICFPYDSWEHHSYVTNLSPHYRILSIITNAFLNSSRLVESSANASSGGNSSKSNGVVNQPFVWENHCKLKVLQACMKWELASSFPASSFLASNILEEQEMDMAKPEQLWSEDGRRQVWYRSGSPKRVPGEEWLNKVS